jgi:hypothetical protein
MALILITIQDLPDGSVDVRLNAEPVTLPDQTAFSAAQQLATSALNAIHTAIVEEKKEESRIIVVDADGLPN